MAGHAKMSSIPALTAHQLALASNAEVMDVVEVVALAQLDTNVTYMVIAIVLPAVMAETAATMAATDHAVNVKTALSAASMASVCACPSVTALSVDPTVAAASAARAHRVTSVWVTSASLIVCPSVMTKSADRMAAVASAAIAPLELSARPMDGAALRNLSVATVIAIHMAENPAFRAQLTAVRVQDPVVRPSKVLDARTLLS